MSEFPKTPTFEEVHFFRVNEEHGGAKMARLVHPASDYSLDVHSLPVCSWRNFPALGRKMGSACFADIWSVVAQSRPLAGELALSTLQTKLPPK